MYARQDVEDRIGTCPSCWGQYKVRDDDQDGNWRLVLHGYQRPGDGNILGGCLGTDQQPLEHSPDGLKAVVAALKAELSGVISDPDVTAALQERLQFAEREVATWSWRPIPGIDVAPAPFYPRRPPTREEIAERLRLGVGMQESLERARAEEIKASRASRPPGLSVRFIVPDPSPNLLKAVQEACAALRPRGSSGLGPSQSVCDDLAGFRRWREAVLESRIAESAIRLDQDRLRLAVARCASNWLAANDFHATRPESMVRTGIIETTTKFTSVTWEVYKRVEEVFDGVAERHLTATRVEWMLEAGNVHSLAKALRIDPVDQSKMKTSLKPDRLPAYPNWESLKEWNGKDAAEIVGALNWFAARMDEVDWLWRIPDHLVPFLEPALLTRQHVAIDFNGNAVVCDHRGKWHINPVEEFGDLLGLADADADTLSEAGVVGVSGDGLAFLPEYEEARYVRSRIVSVDDLLKEMALLKSNGSTTHNRSK